MTRTRLSGLASCIALPTAAGLVTLGLLTLGLLAGGCIGVTAKPPPGAGAPIKKCSADPIDAEDGLIDDFEDGNTVIAPVAGREGYWFKSADSGGSFFGPEDIGPIPESRDGSLAIHPSGKTGTGDPTAVWGAIFGASLAQAGKPLDASRYVGVSFWAKVTEESTRGIRFELADGNTHPEGGVCTTCWNHFGRDLNFTTEWKKYTVMFRSMAQEDGWGDPRPGNLDPSKLHSMGFKIKPGRPFDFMLDDIKFLTCE